MVKFYLCLLCFFSVSLSAMTSQEDLSDEIALKVEIHDELAIENKPLYAKLIIHHPHYAQIDESSFEIEGQAVSMQLLSAGKQSSIFIVNGKKQEKHQTISCYIFEVKGKAKGPQSLPAVNLMIGGKPYHTEPISYLVSGTEKSGYFSLSAFIDAPKPLYPGQNFTVTYRISMAEAVEIFYDNLPLLDLKDFKKSGKRKNRVFYQGNRRVEEYSQSYEVEKPGDFKVEASFLEGRAYTEDFFGRRRYKKEMLRAEAGEESFKVVEFPTEGQPTSFNGAIGDFNMSVLLDSGNQVCVGDKLKLKIVFQGKEGLSSIRMPNLSNQEGFKDNFRFNDLPLFAKKENAQKIFICELRPMKEAITEIPAFEFSYYDPEKKAYSHTTSTPIPITLLPMKQIKEPLMADVRAQSMKEIENEKQDALESPSFEEEVAPSLIEIQGAYPIDAKKVYSLKKEYYLLYWVIGFVAIIVSQLLIRYFFFSRKQNRNSAFYFQEALKNQDQLQKYQLLLEKALLLRLKEQKFIKDISSVEQLGPQGIAGEVKDFMQSLSEELFSGQHSFSLKESQTKAKALYKKIGENF